jgi:hypothetical protein
MIGNEVMRNSHKNTYLICAALGLWPGVSLAQSGDSAVAQALFDQAKQLMATGHAAEACPKLQESQRLDPRSGTLINLARCYEQTSRLASAWSTYIEAATAAKAAHNSEREAVARERSAALAPRLSKLTISVAPASKSLQGLELTRDGVAVREPEWGLALPTDAGEHEITAKAPGYEPFETKVSVNGEGVTVPVNVPELAPEAGPTVAPATTELPPSAPVQNAPHGLGTTRAAALVAMGVGVAGVGVGTVFGLLSKSKHDDAAKACVGAACPDSNSLAAANAAQRDGNVSTVAMIVGGVGLVTGVTLWFAAPKTNDQAPSAQVGLGFGTVQVKGAF